MNTPHKQAELSRRELGEYSRFVKRIRARYGELSFKLPGAKFQKGDLDLLFDDLLDLFSKKDDALRVLRQIAICHIVSQDCKGSLSLNDVTQMMTLLAEWALHKAYTFSMKSLCVKFGHPSNKADEPANFWIIGMGKLGANELNVSSDIDLIYVYDELGFTNPVKDHNYEDALNAVERQSISNQDFYTKLVHEIQFYLDAVSEHGRVFRIDLALRPHGMSGPSVLCLNALEDYLQAQGREWERFAWLKSRVVAPKSYPGLPDGLLQIVTPFVYRRYLDYQIFDALRSLHHQIREQAKRFAAGRPARQNDIKVGYGGIREIEFVTQLLQIVRGGQFPELRVRPTLEALAQLERSRVMSEKSVTNLTKAYTFLRNLEHRIQYLEDQQTHLLPTSQEDLEWIAQSMGIDSVQDFLAVLTFHRDNVNGEFQTLLGSSSVEDKNDSKVENPSFDFEQIEFSGQGDYELVARIKQLLNSPRAKMLGEASRTKLNALINRTYFWNLEDPTKQIGAIRWCDWMELLLRREIYLALLIERPNIHKNLIYILGASRWANNYLSQHPSLIDDLSEIELHPQRFNSDEFQANLITRITHLEQIDPKDEESLLNCLRRAHHSELFLCLARDLAGQLSIQEVADDLSALAQSIIQVTAQVIWRRLSAAQPKLSSFAIVGYGKLGGKELGYGSDLDIVFIYDDPTGESSQIYAMFARKIIQWLSVKTTAGDLYEIDTALRPNGNSGLLVTQLEAFESYQLQRGSNTAWLWEHQAMTRARVVMGDEFFVSKFNSIRHRVLTTKRELLSLRLEIVTMRDRLLGAHPVKLGSFNLKYSEGAMVDVEFAVQYMVLAFSWKFNALTENIGNLALLSLAGQLGLISQTIADGAIKAYTNYRYHQHVARLDERNLIFDSSQFMDDQLHVRALWGTLLG